MPSFHMYFSCFWAFVTLICLSILKPFSNCFFLKYGFMINFYYLVSQVPSSIFFPFKIILAILGIMFFHVKFKISLSRAIKCPFGILIIMMNF